MFSRLSAVIYACHLLNPAAMLSNSVFMLATLSLVDHCEGLPSDTGSATDGPAKPRPFPDTATHRERGCACVGIRVHSRSCPRASMMFHREREQAFAPVFFAFARDGAGPSVAHALARSSSCQNIRAVKLRSASRWHSFLSGRESRPPTIHDHAVLSCADPVSPRWHL